MTKTTKKKKHILLQKTDSLMGLGFRISRVTLGPASKPPFTVGCYILAAPCVLQSLIIFHLLAPR